MNESNHTHTGCGSAPDAQHTEIHGPVSVTHTRHLAPLVLLFAVLSFIVSHLVVTLFSLRLGSWTAMQLAVALGVARTLDRTRHSRARPLSRTRAQWPKEQRSMSDAARKWRQQLLNIAVARLARSIARSLIAHVMSCWSCASVEQQATGACMSIGSTVVKSRHAILCSKRARTQGHRGRYCVETG